MSADKDTRDWTIGAKWKAETTWDDYKTRLLPGDLVRTEFGLAIVSEAHGNYSPYAVRHLPGQTSHIVIMTGYADAAKSAWYADEELQLVEQGPMSRMRERGEYERSATT